MHSPKVLSPLDILYIQCDRATDSSISPPKEERLRHKGFAQTSPLPPLPPFSQWYFSHPPLYKAKCPRGAEVAMGGERHWLVILTEQSNTTEEGSEQYLCWNIF